MEIKGYSPLHISKTGTLTPDAVKCHVQDTPYFCTHVYGGYSSAGDTVGRF